MTGIGFDAGLDYAAGPVAVVNIEPALRRVAAFWQRLLRDVGALMTRHEMQAMRVDTGLSRTHVTFQVAEDGESVNAGILAPFVAGGGVGVATYPAMMEHGIRRHFVSFTNEDGSLRETLINWATRHGFKVWRSEATGRAVKNRKPGSRLAMRGLMVWGYAHPWLTAARERTEMELPGLLAGYEGTL
ncbi:hypothetical protein FJY70_01145 [candidate division WOR-3 bacterium]|nr:hypothetical protein [candidate division WOR-3 bacterium]MBM3314259.1 hypothetical protein [candidate division WOR-3 bacterium]